MAKALQLFQQLQITEDEVAESEPRLPPVSLVKSSCTGSRTSLKYMIGPLKKPLNRIGIPKKASKRIGIPSKNPSNRIGPPKKALTERIGTPLKGP